MIIQILLLTMGLDMSRPEFEPTTDVSGDYVVGTYDVSSDDFIVEELEEVPEEVAPSVDDSLSTSRVRGINENTVTSYLVSGFNFNSNTNIIFSAPAEALSVIPVSYGYTYEITSDAPVLRFATSIADGVLSTRLDSFTFTPSEDGYVFAYKTRTISATYNSVGGNDDPSGNDPSGNDPSGGDFDDSNIVNALVDVNNTLGLVYDRLRAIGLYVLFVFAYPIALAIVKNIVGGDK